MRAASPYHAYVSLSALTHVQAFILLKERPPLQRRSGPSWGNRCRSWAVIGGTFSVPVSLQTLEDDLEKLADSVLAVYDPLTLTLKSDTGI